MTETLLSSVIAYASTNIDDIFILMLLFTQTSAKFQRILFGKFIGIGLLTAVSLLCAFSLSFFPQEYIRFLGIAPILLGVIAFFDYRKESNPQISLGNHSVSSAIWSTALITVANGADNVGVYVPLFVGYTLPQMLVTVLVFALMTVLWCILGSKMARLTFIGRTIERYKNIAVPAIYILLGVYILFF